MGFYNTKSTKKFYTYHVSPTMILRKHISLQRVKLKVNIVVYQIRLDNQLPAHLDSDYNTAVADSLTGLAIRSR